MATLEKFKVAEREHKEILLAGIGQGVVQRSAKRVDAMKQLCTTARENYSDHCKSAPVLRGSQKPLPAATSRRAHVIGASVVSKRLRLLQSPLANLKKSRRVFPVILKTNRHSTVRDVRTLQIH
jgi:hypothetical protein